MAARESIRLLLLTNLLIFFTYLLLWTIEFDERDVSSLESDWSTSTNTNYPFPTPLSYPIRRDGTILVSNAAHGSCRDSVFMLSEAGFQVVLGVKDLAERSSFLYSIRKGMEFSNFSLSDPSLYPPLIYRLRQIRRDLDRPYVGVLINLLPLLREIGLKNLNILDLNHIDDLYRVHFKSPMRLIQASLELNRYQSEEEKHQNRAKFLNESNSITNDSIAHNNDNNDDRNQSTIWDAHAFRIVIFASDYSREPRCSAICLMQNMFIDFAKLIVSPKSNLVRNISLSVVYELPSSFQSEKLEKYEQSIDWVLDPTADIQKQWKDGEAEGISNRELISRAIVHAFISRKPREIYWAYSSTSQPPR